jgi:hypothetical protein
MKALRKLKKENLGESKYVELKKLIIGEDFHSLHFFSLCEEKETKIICIEKVDRKSFLGKSFHRARGKENIEYCRELFPQLNIKLGELNPTFFKENKFRPFGGRSKPEKLLKNETFFTQKSTDFKMEDAFPFLMDDDFWKKLNLSIQQKQLKFVEFVKEEKKWIIEFFNGEVFKVDSLIWGLPPWKLLKLIRKKSTFDNKFIEYCEGTKGPFSLSIKFHLTKMVSKNKETLFIPLSLTHDWGHFIGEFYSYSNEFFLEFQNFFDPEEINEEGLSKRIKILKRSLDKIYPQFSSCIQREFISVNENTTQSFFSNNDSLESLKEGLFFVGEDAPLLGGQKLVENNSYLKLSHFSRGLASCYENLGLARD